MALSVPRAQAEGQAQAARCGCFAAAYMQIPAAISWQLWCSDDQVSGQPGALRLLHHPRLPWTTGSGQCKAPCWPSLPECYVSPKQPTRPVA